MVEQSKACVGGVGIFSFLIFGLWIDTKSLRSKKLRKKLRAHQMCGEEDFAEECEGRK